MVINAELLFLCLELLFKDNNGDIKKILNYLERNQNDFKKLIKLSK